MFQDHFVTSTAGVVDISRILEPRGGPSSTLPPSEAVSTSGQQATQSSAPLQPLPVQQPIAPYPYSSAVTPGIPPNQPFVPGQHAYLPSIAPAMAYGHEPTPMGRDPGAGSYVAPSPVKRPPPDETHPFEPPAKKQSKWSAEENELIIRLRGDGMKWDDVSKHLPGRSAISCRLHYQNFLERRPDWDEEKKNKLARLYER